MVIPPITANTSSSSTTPPANSTSTTSNNLLSPTDFMTLLVSQLKNQDPTQPMDPNQFMDQLVGFNSLETQLGMKQDLDSLVTSLNSGTGNTGSNNSTNNSTTGLP